MTDNPTAPAVTTADLIADARQKLRLGQLDAAAAAARAALAAAPTDPAALVTMASVLNAAGDIAQAATLLDRAIDAQPDHADAYSVRAVVRLRAGDRAAALGDAETVIALKPDSAPGWRLVGAIRFQSHDLAGAIAAVTQASERDPANLAYMINLAELHREAGQRDEARRWLETAREAAAAQPDARQFNLLAGAFLDLGDRAQALRATIASLGLEDTPEGQRLFLDALRGVGAAQADPAVRTILARAIGEAWGRPESLQRLGGEIVRRELAAADTAGWIAAARENALLLALLASAPICDVDLERALTDARRRQLTDALADAPPADPAFTFEAALARQAFINEYVFAVSDRETAQVATLTARLTAALSTGKTPPVSQLVAFAAYAPLGDLPYSHVLSGQALPRPVAALLRQQIVEPLEEHQDLDAVPRLTAIRDAVSREVQAQYEANPYPRWIRAPRPQAAATVERVLRQMFPRAALAPVPNGAAPEVLVAGCGSGQHSIATARRFVGARVLAVDLSLASLAYARRKTRELGLTSIEYGQADLLELPGLGRAFDVIDCVGVLHHLADPAQGLGVISELLRPGGVMRLGLYSTTARRHLEPARAMIAAADYPATPAGIRTFRQAASARPDLRSVVTTPDFFTVSTCRDLLFHVQEHTLDIADLKTLLAANGLNLLGFTVEPEIREAYRADYPNDPAATDLDNWAAFEQARPETFRGMYQFWVQKRPG